LTVSNVSYQNNGSIYSLFVTNNFNNGAFSTPVALTVLDPYIVTQPTNTTVLAGTSASLSVVANGSAPVSYQWVQGSSPLSDGPGPIAQGAASLDPLIAHGCAAVRDHAQACACSSQNGCIRGLRDDVRVKH